jgi:phage terminase large subunit-like protein
MTTLLPEAPPLDLSLESRVAILSEEERSLILVELELDALLHDWDYMGRPSQLAAVRSLARIILFSAGRGSGKTRSGAEWIRDKTGPHDSPVRLALVGRTVADVRDVMVQGESGLLAVYPPSQRPRYIPSLRKVEFANGSEALCFSAEEPSQLRGPQFHYTWADELAAWDHKPDDSGLTAWDNAQIATRLGSHPQLFVTTTPKRTPVMRELYALAEEETNEVELHTASTFDNPHLAQVYLDVILRRYEGTRLGAQELYAQMLADVQGALWKLEEIDADRVESHGFQLPPLRVVGVDPSVADEPGDECGIVVCGATSEIRPIERQAFVLADRSVLGPPSVWAAAAVEAARTYSCPIVAEANQGGALVREVIHSLDPGVAVKLVHAKQGKALRAEPVTLAYDQHRIHHVGRFLSLEDQMTTWVPGETAKSPDRLDAMVHGMTALIVPAAVRSGVGSTSVSGPGSRGRIPTGAAAVTSRNSINGRRAG